MKEFLIAFDDLLSKIPFNGNKTAISASVHAFLPYVSPLLPFLGPAAPILSTLSLSITALGLLHKSIKSFNK